MSSASTVVVSGAGSGIGRAVARRLVTDGFHVTAVGRRTEPLADLASELGGEVNPVAADVATETGAASVAASLAGRTCAGVVSAAGGLASGETDASGLERVRQDWQASFESNVLTAVLLVAALREPIERGGGRVVLVSSVAALRGSGGGPYGAMKAALHGLVYDLAAELGPHGGTANVVAPGFVPDTGFWAGADPGVPAAPGWPNPDRPGRHAGGGRLPDRLAARSGRRLDDRPDPVPERRRRPRPLSPVAAEPGSRRPGSRRTR